jgi:cytochrome P450
MSEKPVRTAAVALERELPPGPVRRYPGDFVVSLFRDALGFLERAAGAGDIVFFRMGPERVYLLNHPDHIRNVLVTHQRYFKKGRALERARMLLGEGLLTSEGALHLRQRRMIQPEFHRSAVARYAEAMIRLSERQSRHWRDEATLDVHREMSALALSIAGRTLFGAELDSEAGEVAEALDTTFRRFMNTFYVPWGDLLLRLPVPATLRFRRAMKRLESIVYRMIADRREVRSEGEDLLSLLLRARDTEGDGAHMSDRQVRDEVLTFFLAGHETTANALTWTWYLLARHPEVETRFHEEVDAWEPGASLNGDLAALPYTRMVLRESMRLYPPAWAIARRAIAEVEVGGYVIPSNAIVVMAQWLTHRDPRWWPQPERFDPERWRAPESAARPKLAYYPFGAGSRACIGEHFAWLEGVLVLATLGRHWRFRLAPNARVELEPSLTLRPKFGLRVSAHLRSRDRVRPVR